jgi:hypothetical protein
MKEQIIKKQEELIETLYKQVEIVCSEDFKDMESYGYKALATSQKITQLESELTALKSEKPIPTGEIDINFFDNEKGDVSIEFNGDVIGFIKTKTPAHFFNNLLSQYVSQVQPHSESENPKIGLTKTRRDENR